MERVQSDEYVGDVQRLAVQPGHQWLGYNNRSQQFNVEQLAVDVRHVFELPHIGREQSPRKCHQKLDT